MYKTLGEIIPILEHINIDGQDTLWYLNEYKMFKILQTTIMDKYISEKWQGFSQNNSDVMDHSLSYSLLVTNGSFNCQHEHLFGHIFSFVLALYKDKQSHVLKFHNWKRSMMLRYCLQIISSIFLIVFFQYYIT